jgi:hypothetical protein
MQGSRNVGLATSPVRYAMVDPAQSQNSLLSLMAEFDLFTVHSRRPNSRTAKLGKMCHEVNCQRAGGANTTRPHGFEG